MFLAESSRLTAAQNSLIERLAPKDRDRVRSYGRTLRYKSGDILFEQGEPHIGIMIIEVGIVRTYYTAPSGREITLAYWTPGNFVAGPDVFDGEPHIWSGVAAAPTTVTLLPGKKLRALAREFPDLALGIIDALVFKAKCYSALAQMLGTRSLTERLAYLLLHLAKTHGTLQNGNTLIPNTFTHAEMANLIGGTRQWVTTSLKRLQDNGVLAYGDRKIIIKRLDLLLQSGFRAGPPQFVTAARTDVRKADPRKSAPEY
jgi:CRP-like cAMP-binding protein